MRLTPSIYHEDEVDVYCTETDRMVRGDVIAYKEGIYLEVSIARQFKINLQWSKQHEIYLGKSSGLEFQAHGPKRIA